jgi:uncharacterized protein HemY
MAKCEGYASCDFFNEKMENMPSITRQLIRRYCEGDKHQCARYMVKQKIIHGYTPRDGTHMVDIERQLERLFPSDVQSAQGIMDTLVR